MALNVGSRIAHYDVTALIGEGGMGQVYQATDTKLNRQVALKILPEAFATDPDRLARFQREAQVLASLNHPGIAAIYGIEEQDGTRALVLELVEGPTLADRIAKGPIPLDEALPIAKQIAEALEAAHEAGVIHRDLKPANIKVREDGTVKVLDFGLAKALDTTPTGDPSQSPTLTAAATQMGVIMGTAAYMSPEQARGKVVDKRADIWAFGAVLYEMLTGTKPFPGDDISQTLARVIDRDPDWDALPESLPPALDTYLRRCLQREPRERVRDIGDVRLALVGAFETTVRSPSDALAGRPLHLWQRPLPLAVGVVALVVASLLGRNLLSDTPSTAPEPVRLSVVLPQGLQYSTASSPGHGLAISPDGRQLVFQGARDGQRSLFRRSLDSRSVEPIPGLEANILVRNLFFSPDGTSVAFVDGGGDLKKLSLGGALPTTLVRDVGPASGIWRNDDEIVYTATGEGLFQVSADGGTPTRLLEGTPGDRSNDIAIVPNTGDILFTRASSGESRIELLNADTGEVVPVADDASLVALTMSGHLLFERDDVIMAAAFDATEHRLGPVVPVLDGYARDGGQDTPQVAVSASGTLAYVAAAESSDNPPRWTGLLWTGHRRGWENSQSGPAWSTSPQTARWRLSERSMMWDHGSSCGTWSARCRRAGKSRE